MEIEEKLKKIEEEKYWKKIVRLLTIQSEYFKNIGLNFELYMVPEVHYRQLHVYNRANPIILECRLYCYKPDLDKIVFIKEYSNILNYYKGRPVDRNIELFHSVRKVYFDLTKDLKEYRLDDLINGNNPCQ